MPAARLGKTALFPGRAPPSREDASLSQVSTPLPPFPPTLPLLGKMPVFPRLVPPSLPAYSSQGRCQSSPGQYTPYPPSLPAYSSPASPEDRGPPNLPNTQAGQSNNPTNYPSKVAGIPKAKPPRPPRRFILPPGKAITPPPPC